MTIALCVSVVVTFETEEAVFPLDDNSLLSLEEGDPGGGEAGGKKEVPASVSAQEAADDCAQAEATLSGAQAVAKDTVSKANSQVLSLQQAKENAAGVLLKANNDVSLGQRDLSEASERLEAHQKTLSALRMAMEKAGQAKTKADGALKTAVDKAKKAGVQNADAIAKAGKAKGWEAGEIARVDDAREQFKDRHARYLGAKQKLELAKRDWRKAEHAYHVVTGVAKAGETAEQYAKRMEKAESAKKGEALAAFNDAKRASEKADEEEKQAAAAEKAAEVKAAQLKQERDTAIAEEKRLKAILAEAQANGTATEEMVKAAKVAAQATQRATLALDDQNRLLNDLRRQTKEKALAADEARRKMHALKQLMEAEQQLVKNLDAKAQKAEATVKDEEAQLGTTKVQLVEAKDVVKDKKVAETDQKNKLDNDRKSLEQEKRVLEIDKEEVVEGKEKQKESASDVERITTQETDPHAGVVEATRQIDAKSDGVKKKTSTLLDAIKLEKQAVAKEHATQKEVNALTSHVQDDITKVKMATTDVHHAQHAEEKVEQEENVLETNIEHGKQSVEEQKTKLDKAKVKLKDVEAKVQQAAAVEQKAEKESADMKAKAVAEANKLKSEEAAASAAAEKVDQVASQKPPQKIAVPPVHPKTVWSSVESECKAQGKVWTKPDCSVEGACSCTDPKWSTEQDCKAGGAQWGQGSCA
jgi:hypothetical protein